MSLKHALTHHLRTLSVDIGTRHCGSEGERLAADYIEQQLRAMGHTVLRETFPVRGWEFSGFSLRNVTKARDVPVACPCFFSNAVDIEDTPLWIAYHDVAHVEALPVKGRLCFVEYWPDALTVWGMNALAEKLDELGAAAAIFLSAHHTALAPSTKYQRSPFLKTMGAAAVAEAGAMDISRNRGDVYHLTIDARNFDTEACNLIARVGSGEKRGVIGGHYDTAPLIPGALDNATGTAMVLELAQRYKDGIPGWTLDFCLLAAEEYIPEDFAPGSKDYVTRHRGEDLRWYLNIDDFGCLIGAPRISVSHEDRLPPLTAPYPILPSGLGSDDLTFSRAGIPTITLHEKNPFVQIHTAEDKFENVDLEKLTQGTQVAFSLLEQLTR